MCSICSSPVFVFLCELLGILARKISYYQGTSDIQSSNIGIIFHMRYLKCVSFVLDFLLECSECARVDEGQQLLLHCEQSRCIFPLDKRFYMS